MGANARLHDCVVSRSTEKFARDADRTPTSVAVAMAATELDRAGVPSSRVDAELLAASVLAVPRGRLAVTDGLTAAELARLAELVVRRAAREPLQHLLGSAPFRRLELAVGPGVFVPRPETELLAGWGIDAAARGVDEVRVAGGRITVVDLCSGSGAIALAVANEVPGVRVVAVERSPVALDWLRRNAAERAAAGDSPVPVVPGDVTDPNLLAELAGLVDVLLCNPPYVPDGTPVPPEVRHDPAQAVFGGADGLAVIRLVLARAVTLLRPGGVLGVEHDDSHAAAVRELVAATGRFTDLTGHDDLTGRPRFVTARAVAPW